MKVAPPLFIIGFMSYETIDGFLNYETDSEGTIMYLEKKTYEKLYLKRLNIRNRHSRLWPSGRDITGSTN